MKLLLLLLIKLYWKVIPEQKRRSCLFKETCSHYVFRHADEGGFFIGIRALLHRKRTCRKGFQLYSSLSGFEIELADGSIIKEDEISPHLLEPIFRKAHKVSGLDNQAYRDLTEINRVLRQP
jgi:uncharacterized protein